jgi:hypothetical protein
MSDLLAAYLTELQDDLQAMVAAGVLSKVTGFQSIPEALAQFEAGWDGASTFPDYDPNWSEDLPRYKRAGRAGRRY